MFCCGSRMEDNMVLDGRGRTGEAVGRGVGGGGGGGDR